jgi:hypothetical protein
VCHFIDGRFDWAREVPADEATQFFYDQIPQQTLVAYESFQLYGGGPGTSKQYSTLPEVRQIGTLEGIAELNNVETHRIGASVYKSSTKQWLPPKECRGRHTKDAYLLGTWVAIFRLKLPINLAVREGKMLPLNYEQ